jgi:hypothetical protein
MHVFFFFFFLQGKGFEDLLCVPNLEVVLAHKLILCEQKRKVGRVSIPRLDTFEAYSSTPNLERNCAIDSAASGVDRFRFPGFPRLAATGSDSAAAPHVGRFRFRFRFPLPATLVAVVVGVEAGISGRFRPSSGHDIIARDHLTEIGAGPRPGLPCTWSTVSGFRSAGDQGKPWTATR